MIRYALSCKAGHGFEGWFRGLEDFERQKAGGLLSCPVCGGSEVDKALMAPAVSTSRRKEARAETVAASVRQAAAAEGAEPAQVPAIAAPRSPEQAELMEKLRALRAELTANAEEPVTLHCGDASYYTNPCGSPGANNLAEPGAVQVACGQTFGRGKTSTALCLCLVRLLW